MTREAATYYATEHLRDGRLIEIRALQPRDQADLTAAVNRTGAQSLYRRFFGAKRHFSDKEIAFFLGVDFVSHVALVAVVDENGRPAIVAGGRYVVTRPGSAEVAFMVIDAYQKLGIGAALMRHLVTIARAAGLAELTAEVLPNNVSMLKLFERCGLRMSKTRDADAVHDTLRLAD